jgi:hypothetical protein
MFGLELLDCLECERSVFRGQMYIVRHSSCLVCITQAASSVIGLCESGTTLGAEQPQVPLATFPRSSKITPNPAHSPRQHQSYSPHHALANSRPILMSVQRSTCVFSLRVRGQGRILRRRRIHFVDVCHTFPHACMATLHQALPWLIPQQPHMLIQMKWRPHPLLAPVMSTVVMMIQGEV